MYIIFKFLSNTFGKIALSVTHTYPNQQRIFQCVHHIISNKTIH